MTIDRRDLSSERAPHRDKTATFRKQPPEESNIWSQVPEWDLALDILTD
jgi:hypothetical protein